MLSDGVWAVVGSFSLSLAAFLVSSFLVLAEALVGALGHWGMGALQPFLFRMYFEKSIEEKGIEREDRKA